MCLIAFSWSPDSDLPLIVAANRDETYARSSLPFAQWHDIPNLYAGKDLKAGGTWMGVTATGRFAALTNIRAPHLWQDEFSYQSRGLLVRDYLCNSDSPQHFLQTVNKEREAYAGFNLLIGDSGSLWHYNRLSCRARELQPGIYGLSNADLDTPWPKVRQTRSDLAALLPSPTLDDLLQILSNSQRYPDVELPDTGILPEQERLLSSAFISSPFYGTCASTALTRSRTHIHIKERRFAEEGRITGEVTLEIPVRH